ncbi:hypothetical protein KKG52_02890 [Patescibacteria group bacterium]|nr:hypothetical protein [Patescibacteria group bacterium]
MVRKILLPLIFLIFIFFFVSQSIAQTPTLTVTPTPTSNNSEQLKGLQGKISELQAKLTEVQGQAKTLSSQISVMDSQVKLTELRIDATKRELLELEVDIDTTDKKIFGLESSLDDLMEILLKRIVATYQVGSAPSFQVLLSSGDVTNFFKRLNYLRIAQIHDKKLIYETQQAKTDYANQKQIFEGKKEKVGALKTQLDSYTEQLSNEKKEKENLLSITKNSENEYQKRLSDALKELQQIQKAAQILVSTEPRNIGRGEIIGYMGNTGYSFGAHLHFGVYSAATLSDYNYYSGYENPSSFLEPQSVEWNTECPGDPAGSTMTGTGSFGWPMSTSGLRITQGFGTTCYSSVYYRGRPHPAYDMYNNSNIAVKAVEEGQAYFCRNCTGDGGNGVFLFHSNGKMTLYWHLQ